MSFISYWIPLVNYINFEKNFEEVIGTSKSDDISDKVETEKHQVTLTIDEQRNITIESKNKLYKLNYVSCHKNGILTYTHNIQEPSILDILEIQVYHILKSFFHIHDGHHEEEDTLLNAYSENDYPDMNSIIKYYCENYSQKFSSYYENIDAIISPDIILERYKKKITYKVTDAINAIALAQRKIHKIKIELNYFSFLLSNLNNIDKKYYCREHTNHLEKFNILYQNYEILINQINTNYAKTLNAFQIILGSIGIILGLGGIYYGYYGATGDELTENYKSLYEQNISCNNYLNKITSQNNFLLSLENNNFNSLQYLSNDCKK